MNRIVRIAIGLIFFAVLFYILFATAYPKSDLNKKPIAGIDISHYQGKVDWKIVKKQGLKFVYIKATEGEAGVDKDFQIHRTRALDAGMLHGFYHFFHPDKDPIKQAEHFLKTVESNKGCMPVVIDVEITGNLPSKEIMDQTRIWIAHVEKTLGYEPIIYSSHYFIKEHLEPHFQKSRKLWVADYKKGFDFNKEHNLVFAQYSQSGKIMGIHGDVDLDWFEGTYKELKKLLCK